MRRSKEQILASAARLAARDRVRRELHQAATRWVYLLRTVLRERRLELGMTTYRLEKLTGTSRELIGRIERGTTVVGSFVLAKLLGALGLTMHELGMRMAAVEQR